MKNPEMVDYKNLLAALSLKQLRGSVVVTGSDDFDKDAKSLNVLVQSVLSEKTRSSIEDERNPRLDKIWQRVEDIFKDPGKATLWLNTSNQALGGQVPLQLIQSEEGISLILDELGRIEQGIPI